MITKSNTKRHEVTAAPTNKELLLDARIKGSKKKRSMEILQRVFADMAWFG